MVDLLPLAKFMIGKVQVWQSSDQIDHFPPGELALGSHGVA
jgi:hypothetical protein